MCSIIGAFNDKHAFERVQKGLEIMKERGRDGCGYFDGKIHYAKTLRELKPSTKENILGHGLHAIVNEVLQPLEYKKAILISNCEIYNWKELEKKYALKARNDSDLFLKLLKNYGVKKALSLVVILSVLFFGVVGALSVIPHVHGKDFNHSQHETCPVYQFGVSNVHADVSHSVVIIVFFLFCFLIEIQKISAVVFSRSFARLRAPPVVS